MQRVKREALLFGVFGGFGLLVLPSLVFMVGQVLLGEYRPGAGVGEFYADLYGHLAQGSPGAWLLVLGPWLVIQLLRLLWLPMRAVLRRRTPVDDDTTAEDTRPRRIEPTI